MSPDHPPLDRWAPLTPSAAGAELAGWAAPWWIAGGYALEPAVGRSWRAHADVDVLVLRPSAGELHDVLPGWQLWAADPPGALRPWPADEPLPGQVHDIWCRRPSSPAWELQFMVDEADAAVVLPLLDPAARAWLDDALALTLPDHPWRTALSGGPA